MKLRCVFIFIVVWAFSSNALAQKCEANDQAFKDILQQQAKVPSTFTFRSTQVPSLEEGVLSLQVDVSKSSTPRVHEITVCEITPFTFQMQNGVVTGTAVELDTDSAWLIGLGEDNKQFLLAGFADSLNGFNALINSLHIKVDNEDTARSVLDLYFRLAAGQAFRESVVVDEMQLQSLGLNDFRLRYSLPKAQVAYRRWWAGIGPKVKRQLQKPNVLRKQTGFEATYIRYAKGQIIRDSVTITSDGSVAIGPSKVLYVPSPLQSKL